jgi:hypothetical protein
VALGAALAQPLASLAAARHRRRWEFGISVGGGGGRDAGV